MKPSEAFGLISQIIDIAVKKGLFENLESTGVALKALQVLKSALPQEQAQEIKAV